MESKRYPCCVLRELRLVTKDYHLKCVGIPTPHKEDIDKRAKVIGKVINASKIAYIPYEFLFCVRDGNLYTGPAPFDDEDKDKDWFTTAKRVGKGEWDYFKFIFFHPEGDFYGVTTEGDFYKGPKPDNEDVCWRHSVATKIGSGYWDQYEALFFHPNGDLYAVCKDDTLLKGKPPTAPGNWLESTTNIGRKGGWIALTHTMMINRLKELISVDKTNGNFYSGPPPEYEGDDYLGKAEHLGTGFNKYRFVWFN